MLDEQFSEIWKKDFELPFRPMKGDIARVSVDNASNMYLLTYSGKDKNQQASLYQYFWQTKEMKTTALGKPNVKTWGCEFKVFNGTTPVVIGLYGTAKNNAYFVTVVDVATHTTKNISTKPFNGDYELWNGTIRAEFYSVSNMVMTNNGNITFSVEGGVQVQSGQNSAVFYFLFSSAFVKQIDPTGKDVWEKIISKDQQVDYIPNCGSHALLPKGNDIVVLYADNADNVSKAADVKKIKSYKRDKSVLISQRIDPAGKVSKELITVQLGKGDFGIDPRFMIPLEDNVYLTEFWNIEGGVKSWAYKYATVDLR